MSDSNESMGNGLLFFLLGAAVGAAVVALITPKSGPELRADLKDFGTHLRDKARKAGSDLAGKACAASEDTDAG
jgi:gas vesicle protein